MPAEDRSMDISSGSDSDAAPERQKAMSRWQWPIAFGPFMLVVFFAQSSIFDRLPHWMVLPVILIPVLWAVVFKGYLLYLTYQR